ncbi:MAG: DUF512 domain-containing protein [Butyrivibrio sp.]|nr:DUF512 domain-containing protein [Butyrivibrio sp.]
MENKKGHLISNVLPGSIAQEMEIEPGDILLKINGQDVIDIFDYQFLIQEEELSLIIRKPNGEEWEIDIEKDEDDDIGIEFANGLMDDYKSCHNKCIFCFIDQMPKGMRETLYFKDDDTRLSFLQGNYVTLTNMSDADIDRIIKYHLSPINVSFQTTNPELRNKMLNNRFAGQALEKVKRLCVPGNGIELNGQIVLCKGVNDKEELHRSLSDLYALRPNLQSVSIVPVGLSKYRDGLYPLEPFNKDDAREVIREISFWQEKAFKESGTHFVHASDEWYLLAELPIPEASLYDGYGQYENGVGMLRLLMDEFHDGMNILKEKYDSEISYYSAEFSMATGRLAYPTIKELVEEACDYCKGLKVHIYPIRNDFFGERITVSGLLTGGDIIAQLKGKPLGTKLFLPQNVLRAGENYLLDDITVPEIETELGISIDIIKQAGYHLVSELFQKDIVPDTDDGEDIE